MKKGHVPLRTCIGCRRKRPSGEMFRLSAIDGKVMLSGRKTGRTGRGCYVCPTEECIELAIRSKVLSRALRNHLISLPSKEELLGEVEQKG